MKVIQEFFSNTKEKFKKEEEKIEKKYDDAYNKLVKISRKIMEKKCNPRPNSPEFRKCYYCELNDGLSKNEMLNINFNKEMINLYKKIINKGIMSENQIRNKIISFEKKIEKHKKSHQRYKLLYQKCSSEN